jgi:hypothetical protein
MVYNEGLKRYHQERRLKKMPFLKKRMQDDEEPPAERVERNDRIVREVRDAPEYDEVEEREEAPRRQKEPPRPTGVTLKMSYDELHHDAAAHMFLVNTVASRFAGMPQHLVEMETQRLCAANIQRLKDIDAVLKQSQ